MKYKIQINYRDNTFSVPWIEIKDHRPLNEIKYYSSITNLLISWHKYNSGSFASYRHRDGFKRLISENI